jgi:hypothetical protein
MATQTRNAPPTPLDTIEAILDEVGEYSEIVETLRRKLRGLTRGSESYLDLLAELEVELEVLGGKVEWAHETIQQYNDSLPEDAE